MAGLWIGLLVTAGVAAAGGMGWLLSAVRAPRRHRRAVHKLRREAARLRRRNRRLILLNRRLAGRMLELELLAGRYMSDLKQ